MSSIQDPSRSLVPAASPTLDGAEAVGPADSAISDLPSLHHAKIATARRYVDASRAASTQRAYDFD
ncbi:MAG: hypothetical protein ACRYG8_09440 [Janthinobacterium lividum]